ncbi:MAG: non-ribosomal peptide synthetase, partial [Pirellulaceae bacterium]|nr:non-ribosomal peptide synthetase [Pirellulaceae bacterium]
QNFFQLGGSSLQAAMMTARLSEDLQVQVPTALLFDLADIAKLSRRLLQLYEPEMSSRFGVESATTQVPHSGHPTSQPSADPTLPSHPLLAPLKTTGDQTPIFMVHPPGGIVLCYRELADQLPDEQPLIAIRSRGLHGEETLPESIQAMAADYIAAIQTHQRHGPYKLGGWSLGGIIAYEISRQLMQIGESVEQLILLDTTIPEGSTDLVAITDQTNVGLEYGIDLSLEQLSELEEDQQLPFLWQHATRLGVLDDDTPQEVIDQMLGDLKSLFRHHMQLSTAYRLEPLPVDVLLVRPRDVPVQVQSSPDRGWGKLTQRVQVHYVRGHHHSMVQMPQVAELAAMIAATEREKPPSESPTSMRKPSTR